MWAASSSSLYFIMFAALICLGYPTPLTFVYHFPWNLLAYDGHLYLEIANWH